MAEQSQPQIAMSVRLIHDWGTSGVLVDTLRFLGLIPKDTRIWAPGLPPPPPPPPPSEGPPPSLPPPLHPPGGPPPPVPMLFVSHGLKHLPARTICTNSGSKSVLHTGHCFCPAIMANLTAIMANLRQSQWLGPWPHGNRRVESASVPFVLNLLATQCQGK